MPEEHEYVTSSPLPPPVAQKIPELLSFYKAIDELMEYKKITRVDWNDPLIYCERVNGILKIYRNGEYHNWIINDGDVLANDWMVTE